MSGMPAWLSSKIESVPATCVDCGVEGSYSRALAETYRCAGCAEKRRRFQEDQERQRHIRERRTEREYAQRRLLFNGYLNPGTPDLRLEHLDRDRHNHGALEKVETWLQRPDRGLWLHGPPGVGKTHIARTLLGECAAAGRLVAEVTATRFLRDARDWEDGREVIAALAAVDVLLLDDLDTPALNQSVVAALLNVLDPRYTRNCRTIITTNAAPVEIVRRVANDAVFEKMTALVDRLKPLTKLALDGDSRRGVPPVEKAIPIQRQQDFADRHPETLCGIL